MRSLITKLAPASTGWAHPEPSEVQFELVHAIGPDVGDNPRRVEPRDERLERRSVVNAQPVAVTRLGLDGSSVFVQKVVEFVEGGSGRSLRTVELVCELTRGAPLVCVQ